jgi:hypothetical protein
MVGFVYVMSNPDHAKLKIGKSDRDPEKHRVKELSSTSVAEDYVVEYWALVEDEDGIERKVHRHFDDLRPNKRREFFTCSVGVAISAIQDISGETLRDEKNNYADWKEYKRQREEEERSRSEKLRLEKEEKEQKRLYDNAPANKSFLIHGSTVNIIVYEVRCIECETNFYPEVKRADRPLIVCPKCNLRQRLDLEDL